MALGQAFPTSENAARTPQPKKTLVRPHSRAGQNIFVDERETDNFCQKAPCNLPTPLPATTFYAAFLVPPQGTKPR